MKSLFESYKEMATEAKEKICKGCDKPVSKCSCTMDEELKGGQKNLDKNHNGKLDGQDFAILRNKKKKVVSETAEEPPFDKPYKTTKGTITDKSGAKHTGMSRARDLARSALNKHLQKPFEPYSPPKDKLKKQHFGMAEETQVDEAFINGREYASHGLMHPDHAKQDIHQPANREVDFYASKTGDKMSGRVMKNDGKSVHIQANKDLGDGKLHKFKVTPHLPKQVDEVLKPSMGAGSYIDDFVHSKNPKFAGKSKDKRREMALAAYYAAKKGVKEEVEQIDEISDKTLSNYVTAARKDREENKVNKSSSDTTQRANANERDKKRIAGMNKAKSYLTPGTAGYNKNQARRTANEETELDEKITVVRDPNKVRSDAPQGRGDVYVPTAPVPDKKYIRGTPENKALRASRKPINGHPTNVKEENELDEAVTPTVKTDKYSWGTMKTIHHGSSFNIPLHPEHHEHIAKMKDQQQHTIKTEDGRQYHVKREGDTVHFHGVNGGNKTSVPHKTMTESTEETMKSFKDFITEIKLADLPVRKIQGKSYGNQPEEPDHDDEDKETPAQKSAEKRGRGRPAGSKSGARQIGGASKKGSGVDYTGYKLHLPNSNKSY